MEENVFLKGNARFPSSDLRTAPSEPEIDMGALRELKKSMLLVPCKAKKKGMNIRYSMYGMHMKNGELFLPAFTSPEEMDKWPYEKDGAAVFSYEDVKNRAIDDCRGFSGIIINPFSDLLVLGMDVIKRIDEMLDGMFIERVDHSKNLRLYKPAHEYPGVAREMREFCRKHEEIYRAYLLMAQEPGDIRSHWLLLVDFEGERVRLFPELAKTLEPLINPGDNFELMKANQELLRCAASICAPIYSGLNLAK